MRSLLILFFLRPQFTHPRSLISSPSGLCRARRRHRPAARAGQDCGGLPNGEEVKGEREWRERASKGESHARGAGDSEPVSSALSLIAPDLVPTPSILSGPRPQNQVRPAAGVRQEVGPPARRRPHGRPQGPGLRVPGVGGPRVAGRWHPALDRRLRLGPHQGPRRPPRARPVRQPARDRRPPGPRLDHQPRPRPVPDPLPQQWLPQHVPPHAAASPGRAGGGNGGGRRGRRRAERWWWWWWWWWGLE